MEAIFIFIVKSSGLIALFYLAYYLLLRKETFFTSSRWFLLAGLMTSVILPLIVYTKVVWIDPVPEPIYSPVSNYQYMPSYNTEMPAEESFEINWNLVSLAVYALGFAAFMIKFGIDFYSLNSVLKGKKIEQQADFKFVDVTENIAPFSYFDYIVYNSSMYTKSELESILEHEKVHSDQHHTIDVIISRIFCILFWFNPIIWLYKKAILQNLEFIADYEAAKKISDKKAYQYTLLKITTHETCVAITNHFYQSLIKKRIVMLNKNQSKKRNYLKYYAIIPALAAFILLFQIKTVAQEKKEVKEKKEKVSKVQEIEVFKIRKTTTDQELKELAEKLKKNHQIDVVISNVKRNSKNELTAIKVDIEKGTSDEQMMRVDGDNAIKNCGIIVTTESNGKKKIGIVTDGEVDKPMVVGKRIVEVREANNAAESDEDPAPPIAPAAPAFPAGPMPPAPDMSKMPKAPKVPANPLDKVAMSKFEKEMTEFEKKMKVIEPSLTAYGKQVDEIMSKREAIFEKEMEKYEIAMEKFNVDMSKFSKDMEVKYGKNSEEYQNDMKQYEIDMRQHDLDMKQHAKDMKQHAKDRKEHAKDIKELEQENRKS